MSNTKQMWDRMTDEPSRAFDAFNDYRRLSPARRSLRTLTLENQGKQNGHSFSTYSRWSKRFDWVERAASWDEYVIEEQRKAELDIAINNVKEMNTRQADDAKAFQRALIMPMTALGAKLQNENKKAELMAELDNMPIDELFDMIAKGARAYKSPSTVERVARGIPADIIELNKKTTIVVELPAEMEE